jgi:hypothetical protein
MTTATAIDPVAELRSEVEEIDGVLPTISVGEDTALVTYRLAAGLRTEIWLMREHGWKLAAVTGA